jgi:outer membrane receptor for ferrienterochelin and colicins
MTNKSSTESMLCIKPPSMKIACALLLSFSPSIQAQNPVQQVEVKAKSETENARRDASAKTIVANAELQRFGDTTITDAMRRVPGVIVSNGGIQLPGMGSQYTQILLDGEPLRGANIDHIPMNMIDRVEIYRLGSAEFSSAAIAGTINIILKKIPRDAQQQIKLILSDAFAPAAKFEWRGSDKRDNLSYALSIAAGQNRNIFGAPRLSSVTVRDLNNDIVSEYDSRFVGTVRNKMISLNPEFQYKTADGLSISSNSAIAFSRDLVGTDVNYEFFKEVDLPIAYNRDRFSDASQSANSNLKIGHRIWEDVRVDLTLGASGNYSKISSRELDFTRAAVVDLDRTMNRVRRRGGFNSTLKLSTPGFENHDIVGGWNGSSQVDNDQRLSVDSKTNSSGITTITADDQTTHSVVSRWAFFIQDDWRFQKTSTASMGLRWETVRVTTEGNQMLPAQNSSNVWSPIIQTLWQLNPENTDRLRLGVARSYRAPSNFQLVTPRYKRTNNSIENPNYQANPSLRPELAWSIETGYEHNGSDKWNYNLRSVIRKIEDLHRQDIRKIDDEWWRQFVNAGEALSKTVSFDTQFPLTRFIVAAPELNVSFSISKSWTTMSNLPKPDNRLTPISLTANTTIDYTAKDFPLSLGASLRYRDGNPLLVNLSQRELHQAQTNVDLYGLWKFDKKTQLRLSIDNVLKRAYSTGFEFYEREFITARIDTQRPYRLVRLNFEHSF